MSLFYLKDSLFLTNMMLLFDMIFTHRFDDIHTFTLCHVTFFFFFFWYSVFMGAIASPSLYCLLTFLSSSIVVITVHQDISNHVKVAQIPMIRLDLLLLSRCEIESIKEATIKDDLVETLNLVDWVCRSGVNLPSGTIEAAPLLI